MSVKEEAEEGQGWHWRNSMKPVRFFMFDARAGFFVVLLLVHARLWTFLLLMTVLAVFYILERKGLSFDCALRAFRVWIVGPARPAWIFTRRRNLTDTGSR